MLYQIHGTTVNDIIMGTMNWPSKTGGTINENLTGCLQRYVVLGYERKQKSIIFIINNIVLPIIARDYIFDFPCRSGEMCRQTGSVPVRRLRQCFVVGITSTWSICRFGPAKRNIKNTIEILGLDKGCKTACLRAVCLSVFGPARKPAAVLRCADQIRRIVHRQSFHRKAITLF